MGKRTNKSTNSVDLPGFVDRPVRGQVDQIAQHANKLQGDPYQGDWMAGVNPGQIIGNRWSMDTANQLRNLGGGKDTYGLGQDLVQGKYMDIESNPYFSDYLQQGIIDPINKLYDERLMPGLQGSQVMDNTFDNMRKAFQDAQLTEDQALMTKSATSDATMGLYNMEAQRQLAGAGLMDQGALQMLLPGLMKSQAGTERRNLDQMMIDKGLAERYGQFTEQERILQALGIPASLYAGTATSTPGVNKAASTAQGAVGGLATGASAGSALGPYGAIIGALLGGVGGGMGGYYG